MENNCAEIKVNSQGIITAIGLCINFQERDGKVLAWNDVLAELTGYINKGILEQGTYDPGLPASVYYRIQMPCEHHYDFKTEQDVWNIEFGKDIPCSCGNPNHWFIRFVNLAQ